MSSSLSKITLVACAMAATADAKLLRSNTAVRVGATVANVCPQDMGRLGLQAGDECPLEFLPKAKWHCIDDKAPMMMKSSCDTNFALACSATGSSFAPRHGPQVNKCIFKGCATTAGCTDPVVAPTTPAVDPEVDTTAAATTTATTSAAATTTGCASGTVTETLQGVAEVGSCCPGAARTEGQGSCSDSHPNMYALTGFVCWTGTGNNVGKCTPGPVICPEGEVKLADGTCKHNDDVEFTEGGGACTGSVTLFPNADLTGAFGAGDGKFAKGEYDFPQFKLKVDNDKTSSLEVPQGCMAQLFQHEGFGGDFAVLTPGTYTQEQMTKKGIANNDASSIKVQDLSAAGCHRKAKLFEHGWFDGTEHKFKKGEYNKAAFAEKAEDNDVSSLKVPVGCKVTLYEDEFSGKTAVFPPGNYDVDQMKAAGMNNDMVSSMKVENEIEIDEVAKEGLSRLGLPTGCASGTITETLEGVAAVGTCCPGAARTEGQGSCSDSHPNMYALTGFVCWTGTGNNVGKCTPPAAPPAAN